MQQNCPLEMKKCLTCQPQFEQDHIQSLVLSCLGTMALNLGQAKPQTL